MRDPIGPTSEPAAIGPGISGLSRRLARRTSRSAILTLVAFAALADVGIHASVAPADTARAGAVGYLCISIAMFGCAMAFRTRARATQGFLRIRWYLVGVGALAASLGFAPSFTEVVLNTGQSRLLQTPLFNTSEAFYLLAIVLFSAGMARSIVIVDMLQAALFVILRFNLEYSPATRDHFALNHLLVSQLTALFLFLVAFIACLGAASRAELKFLRILACFLGLRMTSYFMSDQVSYLWLRHLNCSLWDVAGTALMTGFAFYLVYTNARERAEGKEAELVDPPSLVVRSLMPSFLALVNVMLGLLALRVSVALAAVAITLSVMFYVLRTSLMHAQTAHEKAILELRNEHLEGLAIRDPLTGIGNRRSLAAIYSRLQETTGDIQLSLFLMDIDCFKQVNDCHGHLHGDRVLVGLAGELERVESAVPGTHSSRLGGDEFALLLPGVSHHEARSLAEELRGRFRGRTFAAAKGTVTLSIGVASLEHARDLPLETLVSHADDALYRAKFLGRNRVEMQPPWKPEMAIGDAATPGLRVAIQETGG